MKGWAVVGSSASAAKVLNSSISWAMPTLAASAIWAVMIDRMVAVTASSATAVVNTIHPTILSRAETDDPCCASVSVCIFLLPFSRVVVAGCGAGLSLTITGG
ncbi:hypothetical protein [Glutamicibacter sp. M10]|uniref:hypothetical protein n=1 Tax=Glutamicibacter sp. M10 TaxID=3023076 RepID=UPI0021C57877|nr:hypothetical protein [Glutamicibacter sp. M10]UXN31675.1 hypothetical protein N6V40_15305 [Glutamicibacter sp. M10]